jgi:hypothetical protein
VDNDNPFSMASLDLSPENKDDKSNITIDKSSKKKESNSTSK